MCKFKWDDLTSQIAHELAIFEQKKRQEARLAKSENKEYRKNVGKAKMIDSIMEKKKKRGEDSKAMVHRAFSQRKVVSARVGASVPQLRL